MSKEYIFLNAIKNPYIKPQKNTVTIRLDKASIDYLKGLSE